MGAAVVVMLFDEQGQAVSYERKIEIAQRSYDLLTQKAGMPDCNIIFDPNILSIATGMAEHDSYAADYIRAAEWIRKHYPLCHISGGVSNLSFSFRGNNYIREPRGHACSLPLSCHPAWYGFWYRESCD